MRQGQITNVFHQTKRGHKLTFNSEGCDAKLHSNLYAHQVNGFEKEDTISLIKAMNGNYSYQSNQQSQQKNGNATKITQSHQNPQKVTFIGQQKENENETQEKSQKRSVSRKKTDKKGQSRKSSNKRSDFNQAKKCQDQQMIDQSQEVISSKNQIQNPQQIANFVSSLQEASTCASTKKRVIAPQSLTSFNNVQNFHNSPTASSQFSEDSDPFAFSQNDIQIKNDQNFKEFIIPQKIETRSARSKQREVSQISQDPTQSKKRKLQEISDSGQSDFKSNITIEELALDKQRKRYNIETLIEHGEIQDHTDQSESKIINSQQNEMKQREAKSPLQNKSILQSEVQKSSNINSRLQNILSSSTLQIMKNSLQKLQPAQVKSQTPSTQDVSIKELEKLSQDNQGPKFINPDLLTSQKTSSTFSQLSQQTQDVLNKVLKEKSSLLLQNTQRTTASAKTPVKSYEQLMKDELNMKLKHGQLLSVKKELVLPQHYKELLDIFQALDNTLCFLKSRRANNCRFDELQKSMEQSYHKKKFEISHFRQIITIAPEFYNFNWDKVTSFSQPQLFVDINKPEEQSLNQKFLDERYQFFRQKLFDFCRDNYYDKFISNLRKQTELDGLTQDRFLDFDPFKEQMWHHQFDPHSVEQIPQADIYQEYVKLNVKRPETIKDFLNKSNIQNSLVQKALDRTVHQSNSVQPSEEEKIDNQEEKQKWLDLSLKTGISVDTLKIIKAKEAAVKQAQSIMNKTMVEEDGQKKIQQLTKLSEQIRLQMNFKCVSAMYLQVIIQTLNDSQRGNFLSQDQLKSMIEELAILVPEWLTINDIKGKLVKINKSITSNQVQAWLKERINKNKQNQNITQQL